MKTPPKKTAKPRAKKEKAFAESPVQLTAAVVADGTPALPKLAVALPPDEIEMLTQLTTSTENYLATGNRNDYQKQLQEFWSIFLRRNPASVNQFIRPTQSESTANRLMLIMDRNYYDLCDEMPAKILQVATATELVISNVQRREKSFNVEDPESPESIAILEAVKKYVEPHIEAMVAVYVQGMIRHGRSTTETIWKEQDGLVVPEAVIHRHPGQFVYGPKGEQYLYAQMMMSPGKPIDPVKPYKFHSAMNPALYGNWFGRSLYFDGQAAYQFCKTALKKLVDFLDRVYMPILVAKLNVSPTDAANWARSKQNLIDQLEAMTNASGLVIGADVEKIEPIQRGNVADAMPQLTVYIEFKKELLTHIYGSTLGVMEGQFGTRAQATVHEETADIRTKPLAKLAAIPINALIADFVILNFGPDAPVVTFDIDASDPADQKAFMEAVAFATDRGIEVGQSFVAEGLNIPKPEEGEPLLERKAIAPNPFGDTPPDPNAPPKPPASFGEGDDPKKAQAPARNPSPRAHYRSASQRSVRSATN